MRAGKDRVYVDGINVPVTLSDIQVYPGDIILGDDTGVVVIPWRCFLEKRILCDVLKNAVTNDMIEI